MSNTKEPFNVNIINLHQGRLKLLEPIKSLDIFENPKSSNFHEEGLFSTEIFGPVGDKSRDTTFSYIPLKTSILHPFIFEALKRIRSFYLDIILGIQYAKWDEVTKDFISSDEENGDTGYAFFMKHWQELEIPKGNSDIRNLRVDLINKYKKGAITENVLVMPAGLRDVEIDHTGRVEEDEINPLYRKLISISNTVDKSSKNDPSLDTLRKSQQLSFNGIYSYLQGMLTGKQGFIQGKWGKRRVMHGTRNVLSSMDVSAPSVDSEDYPGSEDVVLGLWQVAVGAGARTIYALRTMLDKYIGTIEGHATLVNKDTYHKEYVNLKPESADRWTSLEGLEKIVGKLSIVKMRSKPVIIDGYYLALVYKPKDQEVFKVFQDIEDIPDHVGANREDIHPITYMELIYLCNYKNWNDLRTWVTRYPVGTEGSTFPARVFIRTTVNSKERYELDDDWNLNQDDDNVAHVYPMFDPEEYIDSTMVHPSRLSGLGADNWIV